MDGSLRGWLGAFLEQTLPSTGWQNIAECSTASSSAAVLCYDRPAGFEHLSPVTWFGTARLMLMCASVQVALVLLALVWDLGASFTAQCGKREKRSNAKDVITTPAQIVFDCLDVGLSIASCVTFVMRAYRPPNAPLGHMLVVVYAVDWAVAGAVTVLYCAHFGRANNKTAYVMSCTPTLNVITITSSSMVQVLKEGWVPFTFLRSLMMSSALRRIFKIWELPDLTEQLILALADFLALVFTFAGIIFVFENLGNPPGWSHEETSNLSLMQSAWYVMVTVSTVGYGDVYPVSFLGKVAGIVFIVVGVFFFSSNISHIGKLLQSQADGHGRYSVASGKKHIVLTGQVEPLTLRDFASEFFHVDHDMHRKRGFNMCLLTREKIDVEKYILSGDIPFSRLQMLQGSIPRDCERLCMPKAQAVFFLGDTRHDCPAEHDGELLLRAFNVLKTKADVEIYMTLLDPDTLPSATGTTAFCHSTFKTALLAKSALCPGIIPLIGNLVLSFDPESVELSATQGKAKRLTREYLHGVQHEIYKVKIPPGYRGQRFGEVVFHNFTAYGILIIALGTASQDSVPATSASGPNRMSNSLDFGMSSIAIHPGYAHEIEEDVAFVIAQDDPQCQIDESMKTFFARLKEVDMGGDDSCDQTPFAASGRHFGGDTSQEWAERNCINVAGQYMGSPLAMVGQDKAPDQLIVAGVERLFAARNHLATNVVSSSYFSDHNLSADVQDQKSNHSVTSRRSGRVAPLPEPREPNTTSSEDAHVPNTHAAAVEGGISRVTSFADHRQDQDDVRSAIHSNLHLTPRSKDQLSVRSTAAGLGPRGDMQASIHQQSIFNIAAMMRPRVRRVSVASSRKISRHCNASGTDEFF